MKKSKIALTILLITIVCSTYGQNIIIDKLELKRGFKIRLQYKIQEKIFYETYQSGCDVKYFTFLPDSIKLRAIEQLLKFENDSSISHFEVSLYNTSYFKDKRPLSKRYTTQVDALFFINYLALSSNALFYSPYPLLYDKINKKEISTSQVEIKQVFQIYKTWFELIKRHGFYNYSLPLINDNYCWFGTIDKKQILVNYPVWEKKDGCKFSDN